MQKSPAPSCITDVGHVRRAFAMFASHPFLPQIFCAKHFQIYPLKKICMHLPTYFMYLEFRFSLKYIYKGSVERQKDLITSHLHMQLDPFASKILRWGNANI